MTKVKICGIKTEEELDVVNRCMPHYIGFVFAESKRRVTKDKAYSLRKRLAAGIRTVGVFVDEPVESVLHLVQEGIIDLIQLHGNEGKETIEWLKQKTFCPVIKAVRVQSSQQILDAEKLPCDMLLLDTFKQGKPGGSGRSFDHSLIPKLHKPYFIAGGLNAENVGQCIRKYRPFGVDISSGAETGGIKDEEKIIEILKAVFFSTGGVVE